MGDPEKDGNLPFSASEVLHRSCLGQELTQYNISWSLASGGRWSLQVQKEAEDH